MAVTREQMPWEPILDRGEGEELVARSKERAQEALTEPVPESLHPELREALERSGVQRLYAHQADALASAYEGHTIVTTGTASGKSLAFNLPVLDTLSHDRSARALYLYPTKALAQDQARALHSLKLPALRPAIYDGDTPREERRAIRAKLEPDPHQPRHAARGGAAQPQPLGRRAEEPCVDRGGRGARVPRRVRIACRERAPAAAAAGARLRHRAAVRAGLGHDRQPRGAGRATDRLRRGAGRPRGRAARRAADRDVEPAAHRRAHRRPRIATLGGRGPSGRPGGEGGAHHLLPALAPWGGADPALRPPAAGGPRPRGPGRADRPLPRRLHAVAAARDRAAAGGGRPAGGGGHRRPGAGHRHRRPGRGDLRDLPGNGGQPAPDVGPGGAARHGPRPLRGRRGRARPVLLPPPRGVPRAAGRVGDPRPRVRGDPPRPPRRRGVRAATHPGDEEFFGDGWERAAKRLVSLGACCASAAGDTCPAARASPRRRSRCARRRRTRWRSSRASRGR